MIKKKIMLKIPKNILLYFCSNNLLTILGPSGTYSIKLKKPIKMIKNLKALNLFELFVKQTKIDFYKLNCKKRKIEKFFFFKIFKQLISKIIQISKIKLTLIGVGFKAFVLNVSNVLILQLKLGYSHQIFFKIPNYLKVICPKPTKIFIFGKNKEKIFQFFSLIKSYKTPEIYKGKGIFYNNERIVLKEGKKV